MRTSPSPLGSSRNSLAAQNKGRISNLELQARLVEEVIPKFKDERDRQFYREVIQSYRAVARDTLRRIWLDDKGQDIAEYAVMLAVILVIVVGTIRLIGSNANNVFSQAASSIQ
jgi:Flp pilus assembly pilin Flp